MNIRPTAVAGQFYPADPPALRQQLQGLLAKHPDRTGKPRALIVPHAGYRYSGKVAGAAYATLQADDYRRVLLLGPAHRVWLRGIAFPEAQAFATPLGTVPIVSAAAVVLRQFAFVEISDLPHAEEHALEVQLPFLQASLGSFELIPLVVGDCAPAQVAEVIAALVDAETLVVISTDLSHFHPYADAQQRDQITIGQILAGDTHLEPEQACGAMPLNGYLHYLRRHPARLSLIAADNSGDHGGPVQRVVGYASFRVD